MIHRMWMTCSILVSFIFHHKVTERETRAMLYEDPSLVPPPTVVFFIVKGWKKCKSIMTKKSYGTPRYTAAECDVANDVRDARGSSTHMRNGLHRKTTDVWTSRRRDRRSPSPRPREIKFIFSLGRSKLSTHKSKLHR